MATTNDLKNGLVLNIEGQLWTVTAFQHVKPGKGGAFVRTTLKNVMSGKVVDRTFNAGTKVDTATVDRRDMEIAPAVADAPNAAVLAQVRNGVHVRMAVLYHLLAGAPE